MTHLKYKHAKKTGSQNINPRFSELVSGGIGLKIRPLIRPPKLQKHNKVFTVLQKTGVKTQISDHNFKKVKDQFFSIPGSSPSEDKCLY